VGENTNQIEREIRERRADLGRNLDELEHRAKEMADWRTHYRNHPAVFLGAAVSAGVLIALATVPRSSDSDDFAAADAQSDSYSSKWTASEPKPDGNGTGARAMRHLSDTFGQIVDGLLRTASARAIEFVSERVPGFGDQVEPRYRPGDHVAH